MFQNIHLSCIYIHVLGLQDLFTRLHCGQLFARLQCDILFVRLHCVYLFLGYFVFHYLSGYIVYHYLSGYIVVHYLSGYIVFHYLSGYIVFHYLSGYIVFSGVRRQSGVQGLRIIVQSDRTPEYVDGRIEAFLSSREVCIIALIRVHKMFAKL